MKRFKDYLIEAKKQRYKDLQVQLCDATWEMLNDLAEEIEKIKNKGHYERQYIGDFLGMNCFVDESIPKNTILMESSNIKNFFKFENSKIIKRHIEDETLRKQVEMGDFDGSIKGYRVDLTLEEFNFIKNFISDTMEEIKLDDDVNKQDRMLLEKLLTKFTPF